MLIRHSSSRSIPSRERRRRSAASFEHGGHVGGRRLGTERWSVTWSARSAPRTWATGNVYAPTQVGGGSARSNFARRCGCRTDVGADGAFPGQRARRAAPGSAPRIQRQLGLGSVRVLVVGGNGLAALAHPFRRPPPLRAAHGASLSGVLPTLRPEGAADIAATITRIWCSGIFGECLVAQAARCAPGGCSARRRRGCSAPLVPADPARQARGAP